MFSRYLYSNYRLVSALTHRFSHRVTPTGWVVMASMLVAAALGMDTNLSLAHQAFALLGCLLLAAIAGRILQRGKFAVQRVLPRYASVGEPMSYTVRVENRTRRPQRGLTLMENVPDPRPTFEEFTTTPEPGEEKRNWLDRTYGYYRWQWLIRQNKRAEVSEKLLPALPSRGQAETRMELTPLRRGLLHLESLTLASPEPLGLFCAMKHIPAPGSVLVLPRRYPVPPIQLPGLMKYQAGGVAMAGSVGESEEFVALREYRPGDPLRRIHWKSFAKMARPIVKEFQEEFFVRHALVLDTFCPPSRAAAFEDAVSVAASFACTVQTQDSLLDLMFVGPKAYCFTSGRGVGHLEQMLEILASVQRCPTEDFHLLQRIVVEHAGDVSGCICVFVEWDEPRQKIVEQLKGMGVPLLVLVVLEEGREVDPATTAGADRFHVVRVGKVGESLAAL